MDATLYRPVYLHIVVLISILVACLPYPDDERLRSADKSEKSLITLISIILILWIGLRPIHGTFTIYKLKNIKRNGKIQKIGRGFG